MCCICPERWSVCLVRSDSERFENFKLTSTRDLLFWNDYYRSEVTRPRFLCVIDVTVAERQWGHVLVRSGFSENEKVEIVQNWESVALEWLVWVWNYLHLSPFHRICPSQRATVGSQFGEEWFSEKWESWNSSEREIWCLRVINLGLKLLDFIPFTSYIPSSLKYSQVMLRWEVVYWEMRKLNLATIRDLLLQNDQ